MNIEHFPISRDPKLYEAWPDVALAPDGRLVCVFNECTHHGDRTYTRIMQCESSDRGRTWTPKHPVTPGLNGGPRSYNCPRISTLRDGRMVLLVDRQPRANTIEARTNDAVNDICFSSDGGRTWSDPVLLPIHGIVPDRLCELDTGRWLVSAHQLHGTRKLYMIYSDDHGKSWSPELLMAESPELELCEPSMLALGDGKIVTFIRENSFRGYDCKKVISHDNGETWGPIIDFPLPGCHRPVAGLLHNGNILITYRFLQGGGNFFGNSAQNFFSALTNRESALAETRAKACVRIMPIDYDRSPKADLGYSGWVQFPDGEIYIVNYIVDDNIDKGQIRGYSLPDASCFMLNLASNT